MPIQVTTVNASWPLEARKAAQKLKTLNKAKQINDLLVQWYQDGYRDFWNNPMGLSPQQVCDSLGTDAGAIVIGAGYLKAAATVALQNQGKDQTLIDDALKAAPQNITVNPDGTVTIG